jgi:hypothetical protein
VHKIFRVEHGTYDTHTHTPSTHTTAHHTHIHTPQHAHTPHHTTHTHHHPTTHHSTPHTYHTTAVVFQPVVYPTDHSAVYLVQLQAQATDRLANMSTCLSTYSFTEMAWRGVRASLTYIRHGARSLTAVSSSASHEIYRIV